LQAERDLKIETNLSYFGRRSSVRWERLSSSSARIVSQASMRASSRVRRWGL
jgi:hypothetical protein